MKPRLNIVNLGVSNMKKSKEFFLKALGWKPAGNSNENIVFYNHGGIIVSLYLIDKLAEDAGMPTEKSGFPGITLTISRNSKQEVIETFNKALKHGASILVKPNDTVWGGFDAYFADPDGYPWEIAWTPSWGFDEKGNLKI
jgi:uncharacterized protein